MSQMSVTGSAYAEDGFRVGRVLGRSFGVLGRHFLRFGIINAIPILPLAYVMVSQLQAGFDPKHPNPGQLAVFVALTMGAVAFWGLAQLIAQAVILYGTFQDMRGKPVRIGEAVMRGLARFLPIIGIGFCTAIAVAAGALLLVIPGIMLLIMFYLSVPACVVERLGPIASMKRSAQLTKGHRWKVFGIVLLIGLAAFVGGTVISAILKMVAGSAVMTVGRFLWDAMMGAFGAVVVAVIYHDLRAAREGVDVERMAAVFD